jgi:hypothetical protein
MASILGSAKGLAQGRNLDFRLCLPGNSLKPPVAFISGRARVVRVEEIWNGTADHMGVGAVMEGYKFGLSESSGGAATQE